MTLEKFLVMKGRAEGSFFDFAPEEDGDMEEAVAEFKGARTATKARVAELMAEFNKRLEALKKCGKP